MPNKLALRGHRLQIMIGVLAWEGEIGNARIRKLFGLQPVQASRLLAEFRALMGERISEDSRAKVLRPACPDGIETDISLDDYVRQIQAGEDSDSFIVEGRVDLTQVKPAVFALLRKAALNKTGVEISYASMTNPAYENRTIFPHSIVHVGRRWHTRAWCSRRQEFRDFTLGRIGSASPVNKQAIQSIDHDHAWTQILMLELAAHRKLSVQQQQVVRNEYFNGMMERRLPVRACLAQYVIQDLRAALDPERDLPPEFQIEVLNSNRLKDMLF